MLSNTDMIDKFLDKEEIEIDDIFSNICKVQNISHNFIPRIQPNWDMDIQPKPLLDRWLSFHRRYSVDRSILQLHLTNTSSESLPKTAVYQLVSKVYITKWCDGLIWINPALQQNYVGCDLYPQILEHKITYVPILLRSTEKIIHIESDPFNTKADLLLGIRFLTNTTYSLTEQVLTIKINGSLIQAIRTND